MRRLTSQSRTIPLSRRTAFRVPHSAFASERRGLVIPAVLALLTLLMVLGFFFFSFSNQEATNAEYFSDGSKRPDDPRLDPNVLFDWALRQAIMGANEDERQSALWRGRHSILPNLFGKDMHPYSGPGVNVVPVWTESVPGSGNYDISTGEFFIDQDRNSTRDNPQPDNAHLMEFNDSPAANDGDDVFSLNSYPDPDVDHTYPGLNNVFLAFRGHALGPSGLPVRTVIPSFHRPQFLREVDPDDGYVRPILDWHADPNTVARVMRPHEQHRYIFPDGTPGLQRFITASEYASGPLFWEGQGITGPFPLEVDDPNGAAGVVNEQGVWSVAPWKESTNYEVGQWVVPLSVQNGLYYKCIVAGVSANSEPTTWVQPAGQTMNDGSVTWEAYNIVDNPIYEYDVDADGDGIREAVWLDLGFPMQTLADGTKFVPLFAMTIYDADGLLNLMAHGNVNFLDTQYDFDLAFRNSGAVFGGVDGSGNPRSLSQSNQGLSPYEVNPQWALNAGPGEMTGPNDLQQLEYFFNRTPGSAAEISNMEWWLLNTGRLEMADATTPTQAIEGRYGEVDRLFPAWQNRQRFLFSAPGQSLADDVFPWLPQGNRNYGESSVSFPGSLSQVFPFGQPLDFRGAGSAEGVVVNNGAATSTGSAKGRSYWTVNGNPGRFPVFSGYHTRGSVAWASYLGGLLTLNGNNQAYLATGFTDQLVDEAWEVRLDQETGFDNLDLLQADEIAFLQMSNGDHQALGLTSRASDLMQYNLKLSQRAEEIRKRFTTQSWDAKSHGKTYYGTPGSVASRFRPWEFAQAFQSGNPILDSSGNPMYVFPPFFSSTTGPTTGEDPIRPQLRQWLQMVGGWDRDITTRAQLQRLMSINHVLDDLTAGTRATPQADDPQGLVGQWSLTEHPTSLGAGIVPALVVTDMTTGNPTWNPNITYLQDVDGNGIQNEQEHWARRDRQNLARDIYVLLYLLGGGQDTDVTTVDNQINTTTGVGTVYDEFQLREMAQFAINVVNSLDHDIVIDRFAYDKNLANGWTVTDPYGDPNVFDPDGDPNTFDSEVGVVDGVEIQLLTLNEVMGVKALQVRDSANQPKDLDVTQWNDDEHWMFSYLELHNAGPAPVSVSDGDWMVGIFDDNGTPNDTSDDLEPRYVLLEDGTTGQIAAGAQYLILSALSDQNKRLADDNSDGIFDETIPEQTNLLPSYMVLDRAFDPAANMGMSTPDFTQAGDVISPFTTSVAKLDLVESNQSNSTTPADYRMFRNPDDPTASALAAPYALFNIPTSGTRTNAGDITPNNNEFPTVKVRLFRRAFLGRSKPGGSMQTYNWDNPWVEVDAIEQVAIGEGFRQLALQDSHTSGALASAEFTTQNIRSEERYEPLTRHQHEQFDQGVAMTGDPVRLNSFGGQNGRNKQVGGSSPLMQPALDREFASVIELFDVPLYGPDTVTRDLRPAATVGGSVATALRNLPPPVYQSGIVTEPIKALALAGPAKFMRPLSLRNVNVAPTMQQPKYDNRWYRLFSVVEVPTPVNPPADMRVPGRINWNTIRYPEVLAGLIDDPAAFVFDALLSDGDGTWLEDASSEAGGRDWWLQFIESRDGIDPITQLRLPGTAMANPFRGFDYVAGGTTSLDATLLRGLPKDLNDTTTTNPTTSLGYDDDPRRLFEFSERFGGVDEHSGTQAADGSNLPMYESTKHKLLAKMLGNSTTRSNVFFAFVQVDFFEAAEMPDGSVRIGKKMDNSPGHRGFFVIDRSLALGPKPIGSENLPDPATGGFTFRGNEDFDFRSVIIGRKTIR